MADLNQVMAILEQYKANGGDMATVLGGVQALAATGKTPLGLNQWVKSDKPMMEDFNEDNRVIDEKLRQLTADKADRSDLQGTSTNPTNIPDATDLNTFTTPGEYFRSAGGASVSNIPVSTPSFSLSVKKTGAYGNGVIQEFVPLNAAKLYIRALYSTVITNWV